MLFEGYYLCYLCEPKQSKGGQLCAVFVSPYLRALNRSTEGRG